MKQAGASPARLQRAKLDGRAEGEGREAVRPALLDDLVKRGLTTSERIIVDGGSGPDATLAALWSGVRIGEPHHAEQRPKSSVSAPMHLRWARRAHDAPALGQEGPRCTHIGPGVVEAAGGLRIGPGPGIGVLAESLIVRHPEWTHAAVANEVNRTIEGAHATSKSVRWSACRMRRRGEAVPGRRKKAEA